MDAARATSKYYGNYRGVVVDNNDPTKKARVKARIFPITDSTAVPNDAIPWAAPAFPISDGAGAGYGNLRIPRIGSRLWFFFEAGDFMQPVYWAEASDGVVGIPASVLTNYPDRLVTKYKNGLEVIVDESNNDVIINHPSGDVVKIDGNGKIEVTAVSDVDVNITGNANVTAAGNVIIKGSTVSINPL